MTRAALGLAILAACSSHRDAAPAPAPAPVQRTPPKPAVFPLPDVKPAEGDFTLRDFHFKDGETLPELRIHYTTLGTLARDKDGHATNAVLVMHGTGGDGHQFYRPQFAKELFAPGEPLDVTKYFVILPDDLGHGGSSKPSDGLHARFPRYVYDDMVAAEHALVTDGLHVDHLRLVMGTSMGCMHSWMWAEKWPQMMDAVMPLACLPVAIVGRNRLWRRMIVEGIKSDPDWKGGDYETEPRGALMLASGILQIAGSAPLAQQASLATRDAVDKELAERTKSFLETADANDTMYQVDSSTDYDPSADLEKITAPVMFVNSTDDFINPPELGIAEQQIKRVPHGQLVILQGNADTHGHGTHTWAKFWKQYLVQLLAASQR
jgi:homoserine O-acetyltransferase